MSILEGYPIEWPWTLERLDYTIPHYVCDDAPDKLVHICRVPKTGTLNGVIFSATTVSLTNGVNVSFQAVVEGTTCPEPAEVIAQYRVIAAPTANAENYTGIMSSDGTDNGTKRTVTRGDMLAVVFEIDNWQAGDSISIGAQQKRSYPHGDFVQKSSGTWARVGYSPGISLKYDDGINVAVDQNVSRGYFWGNNTLWVRPSTAYSKLYWKFTSPENCGLYGLHTKLGTLVITAEVKMQLLDSDKAELASKTLDMGTIRNDDNTSAVRTYFDDPISISKDTVYYVGFEGVTDSNSFQVYVLRLNAARDEFNATIGITGWRVDGSSVWTEITDTYIPEYSLLLGDFEGGGIPQTIHPIEAGISA